MRMILAAAAMAAAVGAAGVASATTFSGTYSTNVYGDSVGENGSTGLAIQTWDSAPAGNDVSLNLTGNGAFQDLNLFKIYTNESDIDSDDDNHKTISVLFNFTAPGAANGTVGGETWAIDGTVNRGHVSWNGPAVINFGGGFGSLTVTLNDTDFNAYDPPYYCCGNDLAEGYSHAAQITGHFVLSNVGAGAVPEPATWGMMIMGFGLAGATMRRRRSALVAA